MLIRSRFALLRLSFASLLLAAALPTSAMELVVNGGFETGDFTGWSATTMGLGGCDTDWNVNSVGFVGTQCQIVANPVEGSFAAYNSFDGDEQTFVLSQTLDVPVGVTGGTLFWQDTLAITYGSTAQADRAFSVKATGTAGPTILKSETFDRTAGFHQRPWTPWSVDVSTLLVENAGGSITLSFENFIPEPFTGPGGFGLDAVSLQAQVIPEPGTGLLFVAGALLLASALRSESIKL